jgi:hypothetical protein
MLNMHHNEEAELEEKRGLWDNIHAKRKRIKAGSGERMRKPGSEGAPTKQNFRDASEDLDKAFNATFNVKEEARSADVKGVVVKTASGKTVVRKQKVNHKIIGTGNLTDGKPDDTV